MLFPWVKNQMKVVITRRSAMIARRRSEGNYIAFRAGQEGTWEVGKTVTEAMAKLAVTEQIAQDAQLGLNVSVGDLSIRFLRS